MSAHLQPGTYSGTHFSATKMTASLVVAVLLAVTVGSNAQGEWYRIPSFNCQHPSIIIMISIISTIIVAWSMPHLQCYLGVTGWSHLVALHCGGLATVFAPVSRLRILSLCKFLVRMFYTKIQWHVGFVTAIVFINNVQRSSHTGNRIITLSFCTIIARSIVLSWVSLSVHVTTFSKILQCMPSTPNIWLAAKLN